MIKVVGEMARPLSQGTEGSPAAKGFNDDYEVRWTVTAPVSSETQADMDVDEVMVATKQSSSEGPIVVVCARDTQKVTAGILQGLVSWPASGRVVNAETSSGGNSVATGCCEVSRDTDNSAGINTDVDSCRTDPIVAPSSVMAVTGSKSAELQRQRQ